jgi:hypothetical protein
MARTYLSRRADDDPGAGADSPVDRLPIFLRGYAAIAPRPESGKRKLSPGDRVLILDTETTDDAVQRFRIGAYHLLKGGRVKERGLFFDSSPSAVKEEEVELLRAEKVRLRLDELRTRDEFIEEIIFKEILENDGTIVGLNLPFDLSRLALDWDTARSSRDKKGNLNVFWKGGFTLRLSELPDRARLRIKHISRRFSFFDLSGSGRTSPSAKGRGQEYERRQAYFLDVGTLAAALTGSTHSLESLAKLLETPHQKSPGGDYGRPIDRELIEYAINDVQVTLECYEALLERYAAHAETGRPAHAVLTEATLGKAYLDAMGIRPWQQVQTDFPPEMLGAIMSAYFGGRSEVHRRREVVRTLYCDFASMYPTVCTLMGLWRFVIAKGVATSDVTEWTQSFLKDIDAEKLAAQATWRDLTVLVEVEPNEDIFPVRARYGEEPITTIGVNYLTSDRPLWFTLADCVASKLLTGKAPRVRRATRFTPRQPQVGLRPVALAGDQANRVDPLTDDFYRRVIDLRRMVRKAQKEETDTGEEKRLDAHQLALKILANATSYGIFIEVNVEDLNEPEDITLYERDKPRTVSTDKREAPGRYFHPLLGTLITGAARLMLAIAERKLLDAGLDWAFCDTDSMAFAKPGVMDDTIFETRVGEICDWFAPLDPFELKDEVLEMEGENFVGKGPDRRLEPLYCYAISAKRYALFNKAPDGDPPIRKASGHGLGHLLPPYPNPENFENEAGVPLWQEDFWREIIRAALAGTPDQVRLDWREDMKAPAASRYAATTPKLLRSFKQWNEGKPPQEKVRPFNFMLWFHAKEPHELAIEGHDIGWTKRTRKPKPAAPYEKDPAKAAPKAFDRETGEAVPLEWLDTYQRLLRTYARHPETKFAPADRTFCGPLQRRHVHVTGIQFIGKEADRWEDDEQFGGDEDSTIGYDLSAEARIDAAEIIGAALRAKACTHSALARAAKVSEHTLKAALAGDQGVNNSAIERLFRAVGRLSNEKNARVADERELLDWARERVEDEGRSAFAARVGIDSKNLRKVLTGSRSPSSDLLIKLKKARGSS